MYPLAFVRNNSIKIEHKLVLEKYSEKKVVLYNKKLVTPYFWQISIDPREPHNI